MKTAEMHNNSVNEDFVNIQELADEMTSYILLNKYGARFDKCENLEDDPEMDADWEWLNERFWNTLNKYFYEMH